MQQVRDQVFDPKKSKADRKRVVNPHELVENLVETVFSTWFAAGSF